MAIVAAASTIAAVKAAMPNIRAYVHKHRNELQYCPFCDRKISDREESLYAELIADLYKVYRWCGEHKRHEFGMKDIRHLLSKVNYTRFGNLDHYGGIVYKPKAEGQDKGVFGINMERAKEFFEGKRDIPLRRTVSLITGETIAEVRGFIKDIPPLVEFIDENGQYDPDAEIAPTNTVALSARRKRMLAENKRRVELEFPEK